MSEYDAGTLPPVCPKCGEWEPVKWEDCVCMLSPADGTACSICGGDGGWHVCGDCGFTSKPGGASDE